MLRRVGASVAVACALAGCTYTEGGPEPQPTPSAPAVVGPSLAAASYPVRLYPAPVAARRATGVLPACPAAVGLRRPPKAFGGEAVPIVNAFYGKSRSWALHHADRVMWREVLARWRGTAEPAHGGVDRSEFPVLYSGPVTRQAGNPSPYTWIQRACGARVLRSSYLVLSGPANGPSLQTDFLFVDRAGHPLLYFVY